MSLTQKPLVGSHISKYPTYYETFSKLEELGVDLGSYPVQIFTGSNKMWKRSKINEKDIQKTQKYIKDNNIQGFIHSIYLINLSRISHEFQSAQESLVYDLNVGKMLGLRGVVVHVGKALKMGSERALDNMYKNILMLMEHISESCPLLIETPAGQGTEVLRDLDDFCTFYDRFSDEEKRKVGLCLDTCHIFASSKNYTPLEYLKYVYEKFPDSIVLVHFNDSKCPQGSCKDRHEVPGLGHIGLQAMEEIYTWCYQKQIPMVLE